MSFSYPGIHIVNSPLSIPITNWPHFHTSIRHLVIPCTLMIWPYVAHTKPEAEVRGSYRGPYTQILFIFKLVVISHNQCSLKRHPFLNCICMMKVCDVCCWLAGTVVLFREQWFLSFWEVPTNNLFSGLGMRMCLTALRVAVWCLTSGDTKDLKQLLSTCFTLSDTSRHMLISVYGVPLKTHFTYLYSFSSLNYWSCCFLYKYTINGSSWRESNKNWLTLFLFL